MGLLVEKSLLDGIYLQFVYLYVSLRFLLCIILICIFKLRTVIYLRLSQFLYDCTYLCRGERARSAIVAERAESFGESWLYLNPLLKLLPGRQRCDAGTVELCKLDASVLAHPKRLVIHIWMQRYEEITRQMNYLLHTTGINRQSLSKNDYLCSGNSATGLNNLIPL